MKNTIQLLTNFFEKEDWKYTFNEEKSVFTTVIDMNGAIGKLHIYIRVRETFYTVYTIFNSYAEENNIAYVAEYLHRANYGLINGNFELDYEDGEIRYKTFVDFEDATISEEIVRDSILLPVFMFDKYGKNLLKILTGGDNPKQLIDEIDNTEEDA